MNNLKNAIDELSSATGRNVKMVADKCLAVMSDQTQVGEVVRSLLGKLADESESPTALHATVCLVDYLASSPQVAKDVASNFVAVVERSYKEFSLRRCSGIKGVSHILSKWKRIFSADFVAAVRDSSTAPVADRKRERESADVTNERQPGARELGAEALRYGTAAEMKERIELHRRILDTVGRLPSHRARIFLTMLKPLVGDDGSGVADVDTLRGVLREAEGELAGDQRQEKSAKTDSSLLDDKKTAVGRLLELNQESVAQGATENASQLVVHRPTRHQTELAVADGAFSRGTRRLTQATVVPPPQGKYLRSPHSYPEKLSRGSGMHRTWGLRPAAWVKAVDYAKIDSAVPRSADDGK